MGHILSLSSDNPPSCVASSSSPVLPPLCWLRPLPPGSWTCRTPSTVWTIPLTDCTTSDWSTTTTALLVNISSSLSQTTALQERPAISSRSPPSGNLSSKTV